jgi:hypothetical protein
MDPIMGEEAPRVESISRVLMREEIISHLAWHLPWQNGAYAFYLLIETRTLKIIPLFLSD